MALRSWRTIGISFYKKKPLRLLTIEGLFCYTNLYMAEDETKESEAPESGGISVGFVIFAILLVVLVGERLENKKLSNQEGDLLALRQAPELITQDPLNDAGARLAEEYGIYDPRLLLQEQLKNGVTFVPVVNKPLYEADAGQYDNLQVPNLTDDESLESAQLSVPAGDVLAVKPDLPEYTFEEPFWGVGRLAAGESVIMTSNMRVRREAAGAVVGEQLKGVEGIIKSGPVEALGLTWWNIDFENTPDGWVPEGTFSSKTGVYGFVYFWPKAFSVLRWIALVAIGLILLATLWVKAKRSRADKLRGKKKGAELSYKDQKKLEAFEATPITNKKWQQIQTYMQSNSHVEWRQAILEADIMLDEMLTKIGYAGESVGEKLKNVEESDFITLQKAWEAHKVRNRIAHGGATEVRLDRREADRVVDLYQQVFSEFYYI
jgi:hypothetical protein